MMSDKIVALDEWFIAQVERGIHSARTEPLFEHAEVMREARSILEKKGIFHG